MVISAIAFAGNVDALLYPIAISAIGIPVSLITILLVRVNTEAQVGPALKRMLIISSALMAVVMYFVTDRLVPADFVINGVAYTSFGVYLCFLTGLIAGLVVGLLTEYYTSDAYGPRSRSGRVHTDRYRDQHHFRTGTRLQERRRSVSRDRPSHLHPVDAGRHVRCGHCLARHAGHFGHRANDRRLRPGS